jgi:hypothetical protein
MAPRIIFLVTIFVVSVLVVVPCYGYSFGTTVEKVPKKLAFYWDGKPPKEVENNIRDTAKLLPDFKITILTDDDIVPLLNRRWHRLSKVFASIRMPSCKSDLARLVWLYYEGGYYMDTHGKIVSPQNMQNSTLVEEFSFYIGCTHDFQMSNNFLAAKRGSYVIDLWLTEAENRVLDQYRKECSSPNTHIPYNIHTMTGSAILSMDFCNPEKVIKTYYNKGSLVYPLDCVDIKGGCFDSMSFVGMYQVGFDINHGKNMHRHWSRRQMNERLFPNHLENCNV